MIENDDWSTVEVSQGEVEYEIEEDAPPAEQEAKSEVAPEAPKKEEIKELDGIETNGAQKRIRQLEIGRASCRERVKKQEEAVR